NARTTVRPAGHDGRLSPVFATDRTRPSGERFVDRVARLREELGALSSVGTGRDERTCRVGMLFGNFVKRVCTVGWALVGLIVAAMIAQGKGTSATLGDPENAFGFACRQLLFPGALGLLIASILAASMSACSAFMIGSGALFTEGLYRRHLAPDRPDRHYLWVGRISGFAITMLGVLYAIFLIT